MNEMELSLPLDEKYLQIKGAGSGNERETRIELYNVVHLGGSAASPTFTIAHNLPNDEEITRSMGSRN